MDRREFIKALFAGIFLPFFPKGLGIEKSPTGEQHEVWLQRSAVAGFQYYEGDKVWASLETGEKLTLGREPDNPHDSNAVEIFWRGHKLGYVPRYENATVSRLLEHNAPLRAIISSLGESNNSWKQVEFDVYLLVSDANLKDARD